MLCVCVLRNTSLCVRTVQTAVTVKGWRVSRGMLMNRSVVTSQVQLPLCRLNAACSPIIPQALHGCYVCNLQKIITYGVIF